MYLRRSALLLALAVAAIGAFAQTDVTTSRISGVVSDPAGMPLPGVNVQAKNTEMGLTIAGVTDERGSYRIVNMPTGQYTVTAALEGFNTVSRALQVELGKAPTINFTLSKSTVKEAITVTSRAPIVEVANTQVGTTIETEQLKSLPIQGRNFTNLVLLTPETRFDRERGNISISGQRGINTNVTVDGVDYNNPFFGGTTGTAEGRAPLSISQESVKEFTVITNGASVEFGRSGGGFVNVITKSGTNQMHGSGFFYQQPQSLTSDFANGTKPADQKKNQYGLSIGGPVMQDRLFYFASADKQKQNLTVPVDPVLLQFNSQIASKWPQLATDPSYVQTADGRVLFGRVDFQASSSQRLMFRGNYATYNGDNGTSNLSSRTSATNGVEKMSSKTYVGSWSSTFNANLLNDMNATYVDELTPRVDKNPTMPEIQFSGLTFGGVSFLPITSTVKRKAIGDTTSYLYGNHVMKVGADYNDTAVSQTFKGNWRGVFVFNGSITNPTDLNNFLNGQWTQYRQFGGLGGLTADEAGTVDFGQKELALFAQDQWYVRPNVTVSAGVRWERLDNPNDPVLNPNDRTATGAFNLTGKIPDVNNQLSPRASVTWSPLTPKNVFRASLGRFWSRTPALLFAQLFSSNGYRGTQYAISTPNANTKPTDPLSPAWGAPNWSPVGVERIDFTKINGLPANTGVFSIDPNFTNPRTDRFTFGFERELVAETAIGIDYTYAKTNNLERLTDINLALDGTVAGNGLPRYGGNANRPDKAYGRITTYTSDAESKYSAISATFRRRFTQGFHAFAQVTYSRDRDSDSNERNFSGINPEDVNNLPLNYSWSDRDQRWRGALNATWDTPWWGISLSGAYRYATGQAWTPLRGDDANNDTNSVDRPTLGCADPVACKLGEGTHLGRNSERQPTFAQLDLRLGKSFNAGPGKVTVFAECYNCSNRANWTIPTANQRYGIPSAANRATYNNVSPNANYALATTPGTPRFFQLAARFDF